MPIDNYEISEASIREIKSRYKPEWHNVIDLIKLTKEYFKIIKLKEGTTLGVVLDKLDSKLEKNTNINLSESMEARYIDIYPVYKSLFSSDDELARSIRTPIVDMQDFYRYYFFKIKYGHLFQEYGYFTYEHLEKIDERFPSMRGIHKYEGHLEKIIFLKNGVTTSNQAINNQVRTLQSTNATTNNEGHHYDHFVNAAMNAGIQEYIEEDMWESARELVLCEINKGRETGTFAGEFFIELSDVSDKTNDQAIKEANVLLRLLSELSQSESNKNFDFIALRKTGESIDKLTPYWIRAKNRKVDGESLRLARGLNYRIFGEEETERIVRNVKEDEEELIRQCGFSLKEVGTEKPTKFINPIYIDRKDYLCLSWSMIDTNPQNINRCFDRLLLDIKNIKCPREDTFLSLLKKKKIVISGYNNRHNQSGGYRLGDGSSKEATASPEQSMTLNQPIQSETITPLHPLPAKKSPSDKLLEEIKAQQTIIRSKLEDLLAKQPPLISSEKYREIVNSIQEFAAVLLSLQSYKTENLLLSKISNLSTVLNGIDQRDRFSILDPSNTSISKNITDLELLLSRLATALQQNGSSEDDSFDLECMAAELKNQLNIKLITSQLKNRIDANKAAMLQISEDDADVLHIFHHYNEDEIFVTSEYLEKDIKTASILIEKLESLTPEINNLADLLEKSIKEIENNKKFNKALEQLLSAVLKNEDLNEINKYLKEVVSLSGQSCPTAAELSNYLRKPDSGKLNPLVKDLEENCKKLSSLISLLTPTAKRIESDKNTIVSINNKVKDIDVRLKSFNAKNKPTLEYLNNLFTILQEAQEALEKIKKDLAEKTESSSKETVTSPIKEEQQTANLNSSTLNSTSKRQANPDDEIRQKRLAYLDASGAHGMFSNKSPQANTTAQKEESQPNQNFSM